jgi:hypothetical protein
MVAGKAAILQPNGVAHSSAQRTGSFFSPTGWLTLQPNGLVHSSAQRGGSFFSPTGWLILAQGKAASRPPPWVGLPGNPAG